MVAFSSDIAWTGRQVVRATNQKVLSIEDLDKILADGSKRPERLASHDGGIREVDLDKAKLDYEGGQDDDVKL